MMRAFREPYSTMAEAMTRTLSCRCCLQKNGTTVPTPPYSAHDQARQASRYGLPQKVDYSINRGLDRSPDGRPGFAEFTCAQAEPVHYRSGTGKSYLATALGYQACKGRHPYLLSARPNSWDRSGRQDQKARWKSELKKDRAVSAADHDDLFLVPMDAKGASSASPRHHLS